MCSKSTYFVTKHNFTRNMKSPAAIIYLYIYIYIFIHV